MDKNNLLKKIFKEIKKDNLENFKILLEDSKYLHFKNKQKENFLFYSLQSGSTQISQYLIQQQPNFLLEKNNYNLTPFTDLIYRNNKKGLQSFLNLSKIQPLPLKQIYEKGGETYTIPLLAIERLTIENWLIFEDLTKKLWNTETLSAKDKFNYNIAHKIALKNATYAISMLDHLPKELFTQQDLEIGSTPFLTSLKFSDLDLIKKFLTKSDIFQKTLLGSNAIHLAVFNNDINVLKFVLEQLKEYPELITDSNEYGDSPLMSSISNNNIPALELLIPYYIEQNKDLSEEIVHFIKTIPKNFDEFKNFLSTVKPQNIKKILHNEEYLTFFFDYIFHYSNENDLKTFQTMFFWDSLKKIHNPFLSHQLFSSSILGKKATIFKINCLLKQFKILTSTNSQKIFTPTDDTELYFNNEDYQLFNKKTKISSFVGLLNTMPGTQLIDLINKTKVLEQFDELDNIHLSCIGLKKKNKTILSMIKLNKSSKSSSYMNFSLIIQDLLADHTFDENFQKYFVNILESISYSPNRLFNNYINNIFQCNSADKINKISEVMSLIQQFPDYKKDFIHLLIFRLTQNDKNQNELTSVFSKNDKAVLSAISTINTNQLNKLRNNNFTKHILSVYGERKNLIELLIDIAQSSNIQKTELMDLILPKCILNISTATTLVKKINKKPIDNYGWSFIIKNFEKEPAFDILIESYFSSKEKLHEYSPEIINTMSFYSKKTVSFIEKSMTNFNNSEEEINIIQCIENNKIVLNYKNICKESLLNFNFQPLSYFLEQSKIVLDDIELESFWTNFKPDNLHINLNTKNKFDSPILNNYLNFLANFQHKIDNKKLEKITINLFDWLNNNINQDNNIALIRLANVFFNTFSEQIQYINDDLLIKTLENIIKNNNIQSLNNNIIEYNLLFKLFFSGKEHNDDFFNKINNHVFFVENQNKIPEEFLKTLNYYKMKSKFNEANYSINKPQKAIKI